MNTNNQTIKKPYKELNSSSTHEFNNQRQQWNIDKWCRSLGITRKDLENHSCVGDIRVLLDFDQYDHLMNQRDRAVWTHAWNWVYKKQLPINVWLEKRLLSIVSNCKKTEHILNRKLERSRRAKTSEIGDHNNEVKGSQSAERLLSTVSKQVVDDGSRKG